MKNKFLKPFVFSAIVSALILGSCSSDDSTPSDDNVQPQPSQERMITVAGALMQDAAGDGNGGTKVYSVSLADAKNPEYAISVYDNGFSVPSNRTARLQSSEDGKQLFSIAYTGDNGGEFSKYNVNGGASFTPADVVVSIAQYAGTSPRWAKLFDGDKTGIAVNVTSPVVKTNEDGAFEYTRGNATVLALDLQNSLISRYKQFELAFDNAELESQGYHIFRLDSPVLNKAGNKLIIGTWLRKTDMNDLSKNESNFARVGTRSLVVDYPSLENPTIITSTIGDGDTTGYRSFNAFVGDDGNIYQATQRGTSSHILKINQNNQYDNSYVFSLDSALGVTGSYVDSWRYAGNGIAYVMYTYSGTEQGYVARIDLNTKTATKVDLPYEPGLDFGQYQGFVVNGDEVFIAVTPVGKDGNIYILNSKTGAVTKGAKLVNKPGNHYIGIF